jgi:hypothetical protein
MTFVMKVVEFVKGLPAVLWGAVIFGAIVFALWLGHSRAVSQAYTQGKQDAAAGVVFDSLLSQRAADVVTIRTAHTDTITQRVTVTRWRVDTLVKALPPSVAEVPEVKALVTVVQTLTLQVDSLITAHDAERAAWTEQAKVERSNTYALRVLLTAEKDKNADLEKRPTKARAALYALGSAATGVVIGMVVR